MADDKEKPEAGKPRRRLTVWLRERFIAGMLIALPIVATFIILDFLINMIDSFVVPRLPAGLRPETYLDYAVPGFGLIILVIFLTLLGAVATNFFGKFFVEITDRIFSKVPFVKSIYSVFRQIRDIFQSNTSGQLREVVLIQYPKEGSWAIGFIANRVKGEMAQKLGENYLGIFVPTTPTPTGGFLIYVPDTEIIRLEMTLEEAVKIILSNGLVVPDDPRTDGVPPVLGK